MSWGLLLLLLLTGFIAWAAAGRVRVHAKQWGLVSAPTSRSSHRSPTPHGGGLGIVLGGTMAGGLLGLQQGGSVWWGAMALGLLVAGVGLRDDIRYVPARIRLLVQVGVAGGLLLLLTPLPVVALPLGLHLAGGPLLVVVLLAVVWWINLFNFMDGIDGIAGMQAVFMLVAAAGLALWSGATGPDAPLLWWMLGLAAATTGFLLLNWPPALIFMGDVGSTYLGFMIAFFTLATLRDGGLTYSIWLILGASFLSDATVTLMIRLLRGERIYEAHSSHAYQRLVRRWGGHRPVTLLYLGVNVFWLLPLASGSILWPQWASFFTILAYASLAPSMAWVGLKLRCFASR